MCFGLYLWCEIGGGESESLVAVVTGKDLARRNTQRVDY